MPASLSQTIYCQMDGTWYSLAMAEKSYSTKNHLVRKKKTHIEVRIATGEWVLISNEDEWIIETFPSWVRVKNHIAVVRFIHTDFGAVQQRVYLQRLVAKPPKSFQVDHKNRNTLDNRRENLRFATGYQNSANSIRKRRPKSGFRGVVHAKRKLSKPWLAYIGAGMNGGRHKNLGYFDSKEDAAKAYDSAARQIYGDFAIVNFPV